MKFLKFLVFFSVVWVVLLTSVSGAIWNSTFEEGLVSYYSFDETSGTNANDQFSSNNITVFSGAFSDGGIRGNMLNASANGSMWGKSLVNVSSSVTSNSARTINFWTIANNPGSGTQENMAGFGVDSANDAFFARIQTTYRIYVNVGDLDTSYTAVGNMQMHTIVYNTTTMIYYLNGTEIANSAASLTTEPGLMRIGTTRLENPPTYNGTMDELGLWNRTLSASEISDLYNNGEALFPLANQSVLVSPDDEAILLNDDVTFTGNHGTTGGFINSTLYVWHSNGSIFNTNFTLLTGTENVTELTLSNFSVGTDYSWNYFTCVEGDDCNFVPSNRTFDWGIRINSEVFNNQTIEGLLEDFNINIDIPANSSLDSAILVYNNTDNSGAINKLNDTNYNLTRTISIGDVAVATNQTFYWNLVVDGVEFNTTSRTQQVDTVSIDNCDSNTILFYNLTIRDEEDQSILAAAADNTTIEVDIDVYSIGDRSDPVIEFSQNYTRVTPAQVCFDSATINSTNFEVDAVFKYSAAERETEFYNIRNFSLTNNTVPQNINLFDLKTADSQEFLITFKDDSFSPVEDAIITITRKYVNEGVFKTVERPITNVDGQAIAHLVIADVIYTIEVSKNGEILATFDNIVAFCADITTGDCSINLDAFSTGISPRDFETADDFIYSMEFVESTRTITVIFDIPSGGVSTIFLNTSVFDNLGNRTACTDSLTSSSGTLTCLIPTSFGNTTVQSILLKDGSIINSAIYTISEDASDIFGGTGTIFLLLFYMTLPLMFITSGPMMIIASIAGLIFGALFNFFDTTTIIGVGSTILWFIIAGGIILWKITKRD